MLQIITSKLLTEKGFETHGFTAGVNFVADNTQEAMAALQQQTKTTLPLARVRQVHGNNIVHASDDGVSHADWNAVPTVDADAIISDNRAAIMAVQTADCVPVLLACPTSGITAAIHAGWRGLQKGVVRDTVKQMVRDGAGLYGMLAVIGPHICYNCYEVDTSVANHFPESCDPIKGKPDKFLLDLGQAAEVSLIATGLTSPNIDNLKTCTACGNKGLFSYRKTNGQCGRQLSFIAAR